MCKKNIFIICIFISYIVVNSCNQNSDYQQGIHSQILYIVDSIINQQNEYQYITIESYSCNNTNYIGFINRRLLQKDSSSLKTLSVFLGYKEYNSTYLLFIQNGSDFGSLLRKDCLIYDDPSGNQKASTRIGEPIKWIYRVVNNDSLIYIKKEYI